MGLNEIYIDSRSHLGTSSETLSVSIMSPGRRAQLVQLRVMLAGNLTGDITVTLDKTTGSDYDQVLVTEALSGVDNVYTTNIDAYVQYGDILIVESSVNVADGNHYVEMTFLGSGI